MTRGRLVLWPNESCIHRLDAGNNDRTMIGPMSLSAEDVWNRAGDQYAVVYESNVDWDEVRKQEKKAETKRIRAEEAEAKRRRATYVQIYRKAYDIYLKDFNLHDLDANGALEGDECIALVKHQTKGKDFSQEQLEALVSEFDKDGDGKIELEEYIAKVVGGAWEIAECANGDETNLKKLQGKITKRVLGEVKGLNNPPKGVKDAVDAMHIVLESKAAEWKGMTNPSLTLSSCLAYTQLTVPLW